MTRHNENITYQGVVYPHECDHMQHMNVQFYTAKFDESTWCLFTKLGMDREFFNKTNTGMVALEAHTLFKKEVFAGDSLYIQSFLNSIQNKTMVIKHIMKTLSKNEICAEMILTALHIDRELRRGLPLNDSTKALAKQLIGYRYGN